MTNVTLSYEASLSTIVSRVRSCSKSRKWVLSLCFSIWLLWIFLFFGSANVFFLQKLRTPDSDEYVFWFIVVGAYLLIFNFFWLIRYLAEKTFWNVGKLGFLRKSVSNVGVLWDWPKKWHQKKTDLEGRAFVFFCCCLGVWGGTFGLVYDVEPSCIGEMCNGKMRIFAEVLSGGTSLRCGRSISCEELWERTVYPPHRYLLGPWVFERISVLEDPKSWWIKSMVSAGFPFWRSIQVHILYNL